MNQLPSGQNIEAKFSISLIDPQNQVRKNDYTTIVEIKAIHSSLFVLGNSKAIVKNGVAIFESIMFKGKPGSSENMFKVSATSIHKEKLIEIFGQKHFEGELEGNLKVSF